MNKLTLEELIETRKVLEKLKENNLELERFASATEYQNAIERIKKEIEPNYE